ncbi:MAG: VWA domain-containing protein [Thiotrichales bacterium]
MLNFAMPWLALLLPLPLLARWLWRARHDNATAEAATRATLKHPAVAHLESAFASAAARPTRVDRWREILLWLIWLSLVLALMNPQWLAAHTETRTSGYDLMLAIDGSRSMEALDFSSGERQVTRMAVVKGVVDRFVQARVGDRIGLILFGDLAYVLAPLTSDTEAVRYLLGNAQTRMAGDGTAIGDAIALAVKKLRDRPEGSRVLILLTDGENTSGVLPPDTAIELARRFKVRVYAIGVGSTGLVPFIENGQLTQQRMEIDEALLQRIAAATDGAYFRATDEQALNEIYRHIDSLQRSEVESRTLWIPTTLYRWPLGFGLLLLAWLGAHPDGNLRQFQRRARAA